MKRIVICADGTWNEPERWDEKTGRIYPTNALMVVRAITPQSIQVVVLTACCDQRVGTVRGLH